MNKRIREISVLAIFLSSTFFIFFGIKIAQADPAVIEVSTCEGLAAINNNLDGNYLLTVNLSCGAESMIGILGGEGPGFPFTGVFDGGNKTITLNINEPESNDIGLFRIINGATIKNLKIAGVIAGQDQVGAIVGSSFVDGDSSFIINCFNEAAVSGNEDVGGLMGVPFAGVTFTGSGNKGAVSGNADVGGLFAQATANNTIIISITESYNQGDVESQGNVGGLVAVVTSNISISITKSYNSGHIEGKGDAAGLIGHLDAGDELVISQSYNSGAIDMTENYGMSSGGIVGGSMRYMRLEDVYNTGNISSVATTGGLFGYAGNDLDLRRTYNAGNIIGGDNVGGLVGFTTFIDRAEDSFNVGSIDGSGDYIGMLFGSIDNGYTEADYSGLFTYYYASNATEYCTGSDYIPCGDGHIITDEDGGLDYFKENNINEPMNSWDFAQLPIWAVKTNGYPIFIWQPQDEEDDIVDDQDDSVELKEAKIYSWKAFQYADDNGACSQKLKLTIAGKHFNSNTKVFIGNREASSVDRKSNKKLVAKFCLIKLLDIDTDYKRSVGVKNPDTDKDEARKKINLDNIIFGQNTAYNSDSDFYQHTFEGVKNIQNKLVSLGLLDAQYVTGIYGPITMEAVKKFQAQNGLPQTGYVGPLTREKLSK